MTTSDKSGKQVAEVIMIINHCYLQDYLKTESKNFNYVRFLMTHLPSASSSLRYPWWYYYRAIA